MTTTQHTAGPALDALVAERVFGRQRYHLNPRLLTCRNDGWSCIYPVQPEMYSTNIAAAWTVVERMRKLGHTQWQIDCDGSVYAALFQRIRQGMNCTHNGFDSGCCCWTWVQATADTAPLAICLAALEALDS